MLRRRARRPLPHDHGVPLTSTPPQDETAATSTTDTPETTIAPLDERTFADLGVHPDICAALADVGITHPFPIQAMTLPLALAGQDLIGQAKTGTGKTLGFGLPLLQRVVSPNDAEFESTPHAGKPQALVVVPTRELGIQVASDLELAGRQRGIRVLSVYGGRAYEPQVEALKRGIEVVVGTPGRLIDLATQRHLDLSHVKVLVLDEADEMLDMGFLPDVERLVSQTPAGRQTMLFSATMPGQIINLARRYMTQPTHLRASEPDDEGALVAATEQHVWRTHSLDKPELLARVLQADGRGLTIVFCRTKRAAQRVCDEMTERGFAVGAVHGDLGQGAREQALRAFRNGKVDVLVATDVAARGIDVQDVTHVINYECPDDEKTYIHRIGRTGRAGASGVAVTFVDWRDLPKWVLINKALGLAFAEPLETYSSSDHVFTGLGIPTTVTGTLPRGSRTRAGLGAEEVEDLGETGRRGHKDGAKHGDRHGDKHDKHGDRHGRDGSKRSGKDDKGHEHKGHKDGGTHGDKDKGASESGAAAVSGDDEARKRRSRSRRRTRSGAPLAGEGTSGS
jgi:superfamily II DNA/RNA helicase